MKLYSKEGQTMVDVTRVYPEGDNLVMQCKLMGAYSMKIYMRPDQLRAALTLVNWDVVMAVLSMLTKGTQCEDKIKEIGTILSGTMKDNVKIVLGENGGEKLAALGSAMGITTLQGLFEVAMILLQVVLADKEPEQKSQKKVFG